ncbi:hypothetical protein [Streptosporangium sp. NPDC051022]|uniref:hypothetical protein n=1 Tax=Streptosporangium sp. NPDC051022 TaxID=3155752 RepID=UPI0034239924
MNAARGGSNKTAPEVGDLVGTLRRRHKPDQPTDADAKVADTPAVSPSPALRPAEDVPLALPAPYEARNDGQLELAERDDLAACEAAIDGLRVAFWAAGKALQVIRDARLYRATHTTFEEYCEDRWEMSRSYANRLIREWPLAEALVPIGTKTLTESHVRELLPLAEEHGSEAALTVYRTVVEVDGVRVTAAILKDVMSVLPDDRFDSAEAVEQIRTYLAGGQERPERAEASAVETFAVEAGKLRTILQRVVKRDIVRSAATESPEEVKKTVAELRALLDEIEQKVL